MWQGRPPSGELPYGPRAEDLREASLGRRHLFVCFVEGGHEQALSAIDHGVEGSLAVDLSTAKAVRRGLCVVDGETLSSVHALETVMKMNRELTDQDGIMDVDTSNWPVLGFGNSRCLYPAQRWRAPGAHPQPWRRTPASECGGLAELGIDFQSDLICFRAVDPNRIIKAIKAQRSFTAIRSCPSSVIFSRTDCQSRSPWPWRLSRPRDRVGTTPFTFST